jgi:hypothetical protein
VLCREKQSTWWCRHIHSKLGTYIASFVLTVKRSLASASHYCAPCACGVHRCLVQKVYMQFSVQFCLDQCMHLGCLVLVGLPCLCVQVCHLVDLQAATAPCWQVHVGSTLYELLRGVTLVCLLLLCIVMLFVFVSSCLCWLGLPCSIVQALCLVGRLAIAKRSFSEFSVRKWHSSWLACALTVTFCICMLHTLLVCGVLFGFVMCR